MRMIVLADTHGNYPPLFRILESSEESDLIVHLGDGWEDADVLENALGRSILRVAGNCDMIPGAPRELVQVCFGTRILITHGDKYHVKGGLVRLRAKAEQTAARLVLYGHTHRSAIDLIDDILYVNPGSLAASSSAPSYAVVSFTDGIPAARIVLHR